MKRNIKILLKKNILLIQIDKNFYLFLKYFIFL